MRAILLTCLQLVVLSSLPGQAGWIGPAPAPAPPPDAARLPVTGVERPELRVLDALMQDFMSRRGLPGGVLAVTRAGRLVYERGFGFADRAARTVVQPDALFRIASLSKPITAVAVLQLVERGELKLDDEVFELLDVKPFGDRKVDPRLAKITVLHLLQHRGGWNRAERFDPMFRSHIVAAEAGHDGPAQPWDIIRYMAGRELQFDPGANYAYSNFGYCLLGRIIEKVTGRSYADVVQRSVLRPIGIDRMCLGRTLLKHRRAKEVRYYGQDWRKARSVFDPKAGLTVPWEYGGFHLEAMDSHGAWLASARDLLRFAREFDDPEKCRLLQPATIARMFARPPGLAGTAKDGKPHEVYYACGWVVGKDFQDHGGSLPGTTTKLVRRSDGINWVVLFNSRRQADGSRISHDDIQADLQAAIDGVQKWPADDLFATSTGRPTRSAPPARRRATRSLRR